MWSRIASILLRYRFAVLLVLGGITFYIGSKIPNLRLVYEFGGLLPKDDPTRLEFENFIEHFGAEGNIMVLGVEDPKVFTAEGFQSWYELAEEIREVNVQVNGVETQIIDSVFCISHAFTVEQDTAKRAFKIVPLASDLTRGSPSLTQERVDSILEKGIEEVKSFVVNLSKSLKSKIDDDMKEAYLELFKEVIMLDKNVHENERILYRLLCEQWDHKSDI